MNHAVDYAVFPKLHLKPQHFCLPTWYFIPSFIETVNVAVLPDPPCRCTLILAEYARFQWGEGSDLLPDSWISTAWFFFYPTSAIESEQPIHIRNQLVWVTLCAQWYVGHFILFSGTWFRRSHLLSILVVFLARSRSHQRKVENLSIRGRSRRVAETWDWGLDHSPALGCGGDPWTADEWDSCRILQQICHTWMHPQVTFRGP